MDSHGNGIKTVARNGNRIGINVMGILDDIPIAITILSCYVCKTKTDE